MVTRNRAAQSGEAYSDRIPLEKLKCLSDKRRLGMVITHRALSNSRVWPWSAWIIFLPKNLIHKLAHEFYTLDAELRQFVRSCTLPAL